MDGFKFSKFDTNASNEIRAYIYQQLSELEPLIPKGSAIAITVDEDKKSKKHVSIILKTSIGELAAQTQDKNIYTAIQEAKDSIFGQLSNLQNWVDEDELRDALVNHISIHKYLH